MKHPSLPLTFKLPLLSSQLLNFHTLLGVLSVVSPLSPRRHTFPKYVTQESLKMTWHYRSVFLF